MRKTEFYTNTNKKMKAFFYKLMLRRLQNKYLIKIPLNVFDKGLHLIHLGSRLVNGNAQVGKDCVMHINTAIVADGIGRGKVPKLSDGIVLGVGCVVLGDICLGKNIAVGANAVVNKTFEEGNITIAGIPAKKLVTIQGWIGIDSIRYIVKFFI